MTYDMSRLKAVKTGENTVENYWKDDEGNWRRITSREAERIFNQRKVVQVATPLAVVGSEEAEEVTNTVPRTMTVSSSKKTIQGVLGSFAQGVKEGRVNKAKVVKPLRPRAEKAAKTVGKGVGIASRALQNMAEGFGATASQAGSSAPNIPQIASLFGIEPPSQTIQAPKAKVSARSLKSPIEQYMESMGLAALPTSLSQTPHRRIVNRTHASKPKVKRVKQRLQVRQKRSRPSTIFGLP